MAFLGLRQQAPRPENPVAVANNIPRFCSDPEYDKLVARPMSDHRPISTNERQRLAKAMNDILMQEYIAIIPLVHRGRVTGPTANSLGGVVHERSGIPRLLEHRRTGTASSDATGRSEAGPPNLS